MPKTILNIRVERNETGLRISVQSDINWATVHGRNPEFDFLGIPCVPFKSNIKETVNEGGRGHQVVVNRNESKLFSGADINATFMQAKNIREGVTFVIPAVSMPPIGKTQMDDFKKRLALWAEDVFRQMVKPVRVKCVITTTDYEEVSA